MKKKALIIANPVSGSRKRIRKTLAEKAEKYLDSNRFEYSIQWTEARGHAGALAISALQSGVDIIIVAGGDGTLNEVINIIAGKDVLLGILPIGSGNGLARHMGIPMKIDSAFQLVNNMKTAKIDLGTHNEMYFCSVAGMGFDAYVARLFNHARRRGFISYAYITLRALFKYNMFDYFINANQQQWSGKCFLITTCNSSQYGYNMKIAPAASLKDGLLDICLINKFPKWKAPWLIWLVMTKRHEKNKYFDRIVAPQVSIQTKNPVHLQLDGEPVNKQKKVTLKVKPEAIKVIVP